MKIEVEFRSSMSRRETFKALRIALEATDRLARRMTERQLDSVSEVGAALVCVANSESARRRPLVEHLNRAAAGPSEEEISAVI